jgi:Holliday junction resolvasome RuvABC endonuclease subunit
MSSIVLGFDQAPQHCGWAAVVSQTGDIIAGGSQKFDAEERPADVAEVYVNNVLEAAMRRYEIVLVALEGTYLNPKAWKALDGLAELRGRCIRIVNERRLPYRVIAPASWQTWIRIKPGTKSKDCKAASLQVARLCLRPGLNGDWLTEDAADACNIARKAWSELQQLALRGE